LSRNGAGLGGINTSVPNVARIYDYILGGKDNFAADRRAAQQLLAALPDIAGVVRDNRSFIGRGPLPGLRGGTTPTPRPRRD
jgi:S-adenosyl methyltransferase